MITVQTIPHASRLIDTTAVLNDHACRTLKAFGVDGTIRYFETLAPAEVVAHATNGLGLCVVGYARAPRSWTPSLQLGGFDAARSLSKIGELAMTCGFDPEGLTHWCDLEGAAGTVQLVTDYLGGFAAGIIASKGEAGLYVGDDQPLNGVQLAGLEGVTHYWRAFNAILPNLPIVYQMVQLYPSVPAPGGLGFDVDYDFVQTDVKGRRPTWLKATG